MSFQTGKNVWGKTNKNDKEKNHFQTNSKMELQKGFGRSKLGQAGNNLTFGPFGSKNVFESNSGSTSLPSEGSQRKNSRLFRFELGNCSSDSSCSSSNPASGPNSIIGFGMEPKKYNWLSKVDQSMDWASGGSSRTSSGFGSRTGINLGNMVENVFMEEIGKMADNLQNRSFLWNNPA